MKSLTSSAALILAVKQRLGVQLPPALEPRLLARAQQLVDEGKVTGVSQLAGGLRDAPEGDPLLEALRQAASIGETSFFRAPRQLEHLKALLVAHALKATGPLRLLSAGCATGEEAFTLAMLALGLAPRLEVVGLDMNPRALEVARTGEYSARALRHPAPGLRVHQVGEGRWRVDDEVRRAVLFVQGNLVTDSLRELPPGPFDVIALRNVLLYAASSDRTQVLDKLQSLAAPRAFFVAGPAEAMLLARSALSFDRGCGHGIWARGLPARAETAPAVGASRSHLAPAPTPRFSTLPSPRPAAAAKAGPAPALQGLPALASSALSAADRGDWAIAGAAARAAIAQGPALPEPRWLAGTIALGRGEAGAAARHFQSALFLAPDFLPALLGLAQAHERADEKALARGAYQRLGRVAASLSPDARVEQLDLKAGALVRLAAVALSEGDHS